MTDCTHDPRSAKVRTPDGNLHCYWCWGSTLPAPKVYIAPGVDTRRGLCKADGCEYIGWAKGGYCMPHRRQVLAGTLRA